MDFTFKLTNEELKPFFEKIFELSFIRFKEGSVIGGRTIVVKSLLAEGALSSVALNPYDIQIDALGTLPEKYKKVLEIKGVDQKGGLVHLQGKDLYDQYFTLMLKKAYNLGVLEEYKNGLLEYWAIKLTEEKDNLIKLNYLPVCNEQISKILDVVATSDLVKEFNTYIDKKCDEIKSKENDSIK